MTREQIEATLREAAGSPATGVVADIIPTLAAAVDAALNPKPAKAKETRVVEPDETR